MGVGKWAPCLVAKKMYLFWEVYVAGGKLSGNKDADNATDDELICSLRLNGDVSENEDIVICDGSQLERRDSHCKKVVHIR